MTREEATELVQGDHNPALYQMFHIDQEEFDKRAHRGIDSALFRRWILSEWAGEGPGEKELSSQQTMELKEVSRPIKDMKGIMAFTAVAGSYLLDNQVPPCIR